MRPLRLKMTAFGPYAQEVILDFAELAENQMFVITGPTGAGKTTIFDAICYALYGDASNKERQSKGLRSDFVAEEAGIITAVELTFMVHNKISCAANRNNVYPANEAVLKTANTKWFYNASVTTNLSR